MKTTFLLEIPEAKSQEELKSLSTTWLRTGSDYGIIEVTDINYAFPSKPNHIVIGFDLPEAETVDDAKSLSRILIREAQNNALIDVKFKAFDTRITPKETPIKDHLALQKKTSKLIEQFQKDAEILGRDKNNIEELISWLEAEGHEVSTRYTAENKQSVTFTEIPDETLIEAGINYSFDYGTEFEHPIFGMGTVTDLTDDGYIITFVDGAKYKVKENDLVKDFSRIPSYNAEKEANLTPSFIKKYLKLLPKGYPKSDIENDVDYVVNEAKKMLPHIEQKTSLSQFVDLMIRKTFNDEDMIDFVVEVMYDTFKEENGKILPI